jgi:hypothetical protein
VTKVELPTFVIKLGAATAVSFGNFRESANSHGFGTPGAKNRPVFQAVDKARVTKMANFGAVNRVF